MGFTLVEIAVAMSAALIVTLLAGSLIKSGQQSWNRAFNYANSKTQLDALATTITFGSMGRKSNRVDYTLYSVSSNKFEPVVPVGNPEQAVTGEAVEFHYWDTELDTAIMDTSITGTAYALFYLDGNKLMLDFGPYPPGGVDALGNRFSGGSVTTVTLAENVQQLEFSHTTRNLSGKGKGCVRMNMILMDPSDKTPTTVTAATLMRNDWGIK